MQCHCSKKTTKPPGGLAEDSTCLKGDSSPLLHGFRRGLVGGWFACQWASWCRTVEAPQDMTMQECISRSGRAGTWWFLQGQPIIPRFYVDLALKTIGYTKTCHVHSCSMIGASVGSDASRILVLNPRVSAEVRTSCWHVVKPFRRPANHRSINE